MAAFSGGVEHVEWSNIVKPILSASYGSFNKNNVADLVQSIIQSEQDILRHSETYEAFYSTFCTLAADYISSGINMASKEEIELYCKACRILLSYLINRLQVQTSPVYSEANGSTLTSTLSIKQLLLPIRALSTAKSQLQRTEQFALAALMKNANLPHHIKTNMDDVKDGSNIPSIPPNEGKPVRFDLSNTILKQLSKPLHSLSSETKSSNSDSNAVDCLTPDISRQNELFFIQKNIASLQALQAGDILIDICLNLPFIGRYISEQNDFMRTGVFTLPSNYGEASFTRHSLQSLVNDISVIWSTLTLPVMEPVTDAKLKKLATLTLSCLYAALSVSMAMNILGLSSSLSPKTSTTVPSVPGTLTGAAVSAKSDEDNSEALAATVVEKAIVIFNHVSNIIKTSTRAGGHVLQNHVLLGAWLLISGINSQVSSLDKPTKDDKSKSPSKQKEKDAGKVNLLKIQQSFSVLSLALTSQALNLVTSLFDDASVEIVNESTDVMPAKLDILVNATALQRVAKIFEVSDGLIHFFFYITPIIYRKGCSLKRIHKHNSNGDTYSAASGSTTYYDDDIISCSDDSTAGDDDDSEPILGHWFEETLSSVSNADHKDSGDSQNADTHGGGDKDDSMTSIIPEKGEPTGYMTVAKDIFNFMNNHFVMCSSQFVLDRVIASISDLDVMVLAALIRDLDRETGLLSSYYGLSLNFLYNSFSEALTLFTHNLLARNMLSEELQNTLLTYLEVNPYNTSSTTWPLLVYSRTLSVLAQIIIMRPNKETACANVWNRVINTLVDQIVKTPSTDVPYEDMNVEHAQLLLFLFNFLTFMQKKAALLVTAKGIVRIGELETPLIEESQLFFVSRLLLFFDHIMKHLYDPPSFLLEQVQWNLLGGGLHGTHVLKMANAEDNKCPWKTLEENYRKYVPVESAIKPLFYNLSSPDFNCQEIPKLDGLAVNFLLGNAEELSYYSLIEALFTIVKSINITDRIERNSEKNPYSTLCALQYCVSLAWRMLLQLPTCVSHLERIVSTRSESVDPSPFMLYSSIWGPRCGNKAFTGWLKDALGKQTVNQPREILLRSVADITTRIKYDFTLLKNVINELIPLTETTGVMISKQDLPSFFNLLLCDTLLCKLQIAIDDSASKTNENDLNKSLDSIMTDNDNNEVSHIVVPNKSLQAHLIREMMPQMVRLAEVIFTYIRSSLLHQMKESKVDVQEGQNSYTLGDLSTFQSVIAIAGCNMESNKAKSETLFLALPRMVHIIFEKWETISIPHYNAEPYINQAMPSISYAMTIMNFHMYALSGQPKFTINPSLKHLLYTVIKFIRDHLSTVLENEELSHKIGNAILPMVMDMSTIYLYSHTYGILQQLVGAEETEVYQVKANVIVFGHLYTLLINYASSTCPCSDAVQEPLLLESSLWFGKLAGETYGKMAIDRFFSKHNQNPQYGLHQILLTIISPKTSSRLYSKHILEAFNKLFAFAEKNQDDQVVKRLLSSLLRFAKIPKDQLDALFWRIIVGTYSLDSSLSTESSDKATAHKSDEEKPLLPDSKEAGKSDSVDKMFTPSKMLCKKDESKCKPIQPENYKFLENLTSYITKGTNVEEKENLVCLLLDSIIPVADHLLQNMKAFGFSELMLIMISLADTATAKGLSILFSSATTWLQQINEYIIKEDAFGKLQRGETEGDHISLINATCILFNYISDIVTALSPAAVGRATSPPWDTELLPSTLDLNADWPEELCSREEEDGDSTGDDSEEDSLSNKLCTFTITQKEFMNQHWYHCHTCKMVDKVGVCSICARVCHKGHDVTYAKYGNFFCDCGAKSNGTCQALTKRSVQTRNEHSGAGPSGSGAHTSSATNEQMLPSSLRRKNSAPSCFDVLMNTVSLVRTIPRDRQKLATLAKQLDSQRETLMSYLWSKPAVIDALLNITSMLVPVVEAICSRMSSVGCHKRARAALDQLHKADKKFEFVDKLMIPTLGSQEGTFENVRMNFTGDQGQTIRQLISAHLLRRVAMCCLASPQGRRQHLVAVSHEKGKITVHQLSAVLKQADSAKKKLTLTRLSSAPIPFTVLSVTGNPCNEDFLAVCGLKDCHVLTFNSSGSVADHLVLHPQLETGNFIIRAMWLPGSQTWLALVTADFVKIYDLGKDVLSPQYYFLVPTGKIRDVTFVCSDDSCPIIVIMSSVGYIYTQDMDEESSATQGPFYVTNTLRIEHPSIKDTNGQICAGGVSVYYSHVLKVLFLSYAQGKSFIAFLPNIAEGTSHVYEIILNANSKTSLNPSAKAGSSSTSQPLCQWTEVPSHPGLVCCMMQSNSNPVVLMIKPDAILVQEIKILPAKAKIMDMAVVRHQTSYTDYRTTLILLCEDGSLRLYMASMEQTGFWLSPVVHPAVVGPLLKSSGKKKKTTKMGSKSSSNAVSFPVDFFEHSTPLTDIEFGGNDLLQIYNTPQIKMRLNTPGMYVVCTKPAGFTIKINNNDGNQVITGIRVLLGSQDATKSPSYIEVFGRTVPTTVARNRWFDIPLTREESIRADNKLTVTFGPSQDPDSVTMVDSIKVYGKMKDQFGWPEDTEEITNTAVGNGGAGSSSQMVNMEDMSSATVSQPTAGPLDKIMCGALEVLESCFTLMNVASLTSVDLPRVKQRSNAISLTTKLLTLPTPFCIILHTKSLLASLFPTRQAYHNYKDTALLSHILKTLQSFKEVEDARDLDPEAFYQLIIIARSIVVSRPQNLGRFTLDANFSEPPKLASEKRQLTEHALELVNLMVDTMWRLHKARPKNPALVFVCVPGLSHVETTVCALVEIIHSLLVCDQSEATINIVIKLYLDLLLCPDTVVSFATKLAIGHGLRPKVKRRRVVIPSPTRCSTPGPSVSEIEKQAEPSRSQQESSEADAYEVAAASPSVNSGPLNVEAILGAAGAFPAIDILQQDTDDETMVELAIALSLQEHDGGADLQVIHQDIQDVVAMQVLQDMEASVSSDLQDLDSIASQVRGAGHMQPSEMGHYSDATASAAGSDDEGSTAATDGSTLRTSPAEQGGSAESESGGSVVDSIIGEHNVSGRSSAYGDNLPETLVGGRGDTNNINFQNIGQDGDADPETENECVGNLHLLQIIILEKCIEYVPRLKDIGGIQIIPFMQVVFMLTEELNMEMERDRNVLESLLRTILAELNIKKSRGPDCILTNPLEGRHTAEQKYQFVLLRFLSVLMSQMKVVSSGKNAPDKQKTISTTTANTLLQAGIIDWCLGLHEQLLPFWKNSKPDDQNTVVGALLKPHPVAPVLDASPFFLRQYLKGHYADMFEQYAQLLTEIVIRLPYQVQKHASIQATFEQAWLPMLCEYMMAQQMPCVRRQVRKLLLYICGSKEAYRHLRDVHALETHMKAVLERADISRYRRTEEMPLNISLPYDSLVEIVEHLKACVEIAMNRNANWQNFLMYSDDYIPDLFLLSSVLDEGVSHIILQLLQYAICGSKSSSSSGSSSQRAETSSKTSSAITPDDGKTSTAEEIQCAAFVKKVHSMVDNKLLSKFMRTFLLETNSSNLRSQAHSLVLTIFANSDSAHQHEILDAMWSMWFQLPSYGRRASQFVDLIGYFTIKCAGGSSLTGTNIPYNYLENTLSLLHSQNQVLIQHPNASLYSQLSQYVEMEGFYLESEPCLVCNNPEVPFTNIKLSSVKVDSKFTTTTQIVKLVTTHTINKINLRIGDLKRTKMVRTMNIYYNNRSVQAVVELKNKPALWHKAKKVTLSSGQTEAKIDFPLPIVACNLMIEYVDFYENLQASTETLQCPRCSAAVPSNPGVCSNCGENVFQCHKCRAINYDEKDPFLCHVCGFCKYAKFDYTLTARQVCAIEPIDNDEDRKKITSTINQLLEKADRTYKTLVCMKPSLENLLLKITEHRVEHWSDDGNQATTNSNIQVSRAIQMLAQKYCNDCKNTFEELSRVIQKILICRKELVTYDRNQYVAEEAATAALAQSSHHSAVGSSAPLSSDLVSLGKYSEGVSFFKCYGCASYVVEHCLTMLRALCANVNARKDLCIQGLLRELVEYNLRRGSNQMQEEVKQLLCLLTKDNPKTTNELCEMLMNHISIPLRSQGASPDLVYTVRPEINLLATMLQKDDSCWEQKAKCVMKIFIMATKECKSPPVMEAIVLPCLNIICGLIKPDPPTSKKYKDKNVESLATVQLTEDVNINVEKWIEGDSHHSFQAWKKRMPPREFGSVKSESKTAVRKRYLREKYFYRWKDRAFHIRRNRSNVCLDNPQWLKYVLFNSGSRHARQVACNLIQSVCHTPVHQKKFIDILTSFLSEINTAGPTASEFLTLYQSMIDTPPWKQYLTLKGVLMFLADLFNHEIQTLYHLEQTTLTSDLAQGFVLKKLTELIASFLDVPIIKQQYKGRLVGTVLNGYLALRRLVVQRTRIIDETQEKLLELLEEMTSGTESETKAFMIICIETVEKCSPNDIRTPVFIFERLCSIIYPEENEIGEFYLSLEKDPQQEDFLQGRMLGNPYSSSEPGLGPLMRDVKNKICADCELVALLEDDNGMELLVNNKIISLDLPVKLVYKKVWLAEGGEGDAMRIVYRMRGLLGDATEEFVETLDAKNDQEVNNEQVYKMANVMGECGGLEVMLSRLATIRDVSRSQGLLQVLLKLMGLCVKVKRNQEELIDPGLNTVSKLLTILQMCLSSDNEIAQNVLMDQILEILETILSKASSEYQSNFDLYSETCGASDHVKNILEHAANVKPATLIHLSRVLAALTYGNEKKMSILTDHFNAVMDFDSFDQDRKAEDEHKLELFCNITSAIERNALGNTLKDHIMSLGIVDKALEYITAHAPSMKSTFWRTDSNDWKEYISKPALKYILRFLTGLANEHKPIQMVVSPECITIIHRLEQVASDEHVGTLAENLLEALRTNAEVASRIENVREQTRAEKKRLAMAMREKQLSALGMCTNPKGQVTASKTLLQEMEDLAEETGLICVICREGYRFQPNKVLGIYTFTKRCLIEDFESKSRKTYGYSTVTHFNVVHVDCHMSAVRLARVRDEWESAALQNANTRCNGLLPLWGPQVPESAFANCLARHNTYLQECTGHRDISYVTTVHDLKLLLLRFARGRSFHEDTGGGGPQSNMQIIPYLMHMALYVINTTRCASREEKNLMSYLECWIPERWIASSYEAESPYYWATFSLLLHSPSQWKRNRIAHLRRLIVLSHVRHMYPSGPHKPSDIQPKDFAVYKSSLIFYGLVDACYKYFFKTITVTSEDQWPSVLADYIRHNDEALIKASEKIMASYTEELLPCTCFGEFCDVVGLLEEISSPTTFIADVLLGLGNPAMSN